MSSLPLNTLYPPKEFDDWAEEYDQDVSSNESFPFEGYSRVLHTIVDLAMIHPNSSILDLGIGTGNLAKLFSDLGCEIWGLDFSKGMLKKAKAKLPDATLAQADITGKWPKAFLRRFNYVFSAYTFHHFPWEEKIRLVKEILTNRLFPGGQLIIGDVVFKNETELNENKTRLADDWEEEYYWLADETLKSFKRIGIKTRYIEISYCAGVFIFTS